MLHYFVKDLCHSLLKLSVYVRVNTFNFKLKILTTLIQDHVQRITVLQSYPLELGVNNQPIKYVMGRMLKISLDGRKYS